MPTEDQKAQAVVDGLAQREPDFWLCKSCGCVWRDNHDGTLSLGMNQHSCFGCEWNTLKYCEPLYR